MDRICRNIDVAGRRTSFRLEQMFWDAAEDCADARGMNLSQLINQIVLGHEGSGASMTSAIRVFLVKHFQDQALTLESKRRSA